MAEQQKPSSLQRATADDESGYQLSLTLPADNAAADGNSADQAEAKLTRNGYLQPYAPITFQISSGSATFSNGSQQISGPETGPMGRSDVTFVDTKAESGEIVAWMTNSPHIRSDPVPYTFSGSTETAFAIALDSRVNDEPADGKSENVGRAVVTQNSGSLSEAKIVKFEFESGAANFDLTKPNVVQSLSDNRTLFVTTHSDGGQDIADAYFADAHAETVTLKASLRDHTDVPFKTQDFTFTAAPSNNYSFSLNRQSNGAQADGAAQNKANVTIWDDNAPAPDKTRVTFQLPAGSAQCASDNGNVVDSGTKPDGSTWIAVDSTFMQGVTVASAGFTDSNEAGETITLTAYLTDHAEVPAQSQDYTFSPKSPYVVTLTQAPSWLADGVSGEIVGTVVDRQTGENVTDTCGVGCSGPGPIDGPDSVCATHGNFSFSVTGLTVVGELAQFGYVTVSYLGASDTATILVEPY